eukprot:gene21567-28561_t
MADMQESAVSKELAQGLSELQQSFAPKVGEMQLMLNQQVEQIQSMKKRFLPSKQVSTVGLSSIELIKTKTREGLEFESKYDPAAAVQLFDDLAKTAPCSEIYARLSKNLSDMTYLPGQSHNQLYSVNSKAVEAASAAMRADPNNAEAVEAVSAALRADSSNAEAHVALSISQGNLARFTDPRTKMQLVKSATEAAKLALELDPKNPRAHYVMGR